MSLVINDHIYGPPDLIVDPVLGRGTHQTVAAAITEAVDTSKTSIFLRPATYVEDLTIPTGLNFWAAEGSNITSEAVIQGTLTFTGAITSTFSQIRFKTNPASSEILVFDGVGTAQTNFNRCSFFFPDADMMTVDNANASPSFTRCNCHQTGNNLAFWNIVQCGNASFIYSSFFIENPSGTSNIAAGVLDLQFCAMKGKFSTSGGGFYRITNCSWDGSNQNLTFLASAGTGNATTIRSLNLNPGTAVAITVAVNSTVDSLDLHIDSTNATPITGTGTFEYDLLGSSRRDVLINPATLTTVGGTVYTGAVEFDDRTITPVAGSTVDSNSLDFYEEGTWTPVLTSSTPPTLITFSTQDGIYTRIGNLVHVDAIIIVSAYDATGSGRIRMTGLPFTSATVGEIRYQGAVIFADIDFAASAIWITAQVIDDEISFRENPDNASPNFVTITDLTATSEIKVSVTYRVA